MEHKAWQDLGAEKLDVAFRVVARGATDIRALPFALKANAADAVAALVPEISQLEVSEVTTLLPLALAGQHWEAVTALVMHGATRELDMSAIANLEALPLLR
jgi:hypothetical protein